MDRQKLIVGFPDEETRRRWVVAFVGRSFQIKRWQVGIKAVAELQGQDVAQRESLYKNVNVGIEQQRKIVDRACDKAQGRLVPTHSKNGMVFEDTQVPAPRPLRRSRGRGNKNKQPTSAGFAQANSTQEGVNIDAASVFDWREGVLRAGRKRHRASASGSVPADDSVQVKGRVDKNSFDDVYEARWGDVTSTIVVKFLSGNNAKIPACRISHHCVRSLSSADI